MTIMVSRNQTWGCAASGCPNQHSARGLCQEHLYMVRRERGIRLAAAPCELCFRPRIHADPPRCRKHFGTGVDFKSLHGGCAVIGCFRWHYALGLCEKHAAQRRRGKLTAALEAEPCGERCFRPKGLCNAHR